MNPREVDEHRRAREQADRDEGRRHVAVVADEARRAGDRADERRHGERMPEGHVRRQAEGEDDRHVQPQERQQPAVAALPGGVGERPPAGQRVPQAVQPRGGACRGLREFGGLDGHGAETFEIGR
jgi:hypothetical protein